MYVAVKGGEQAILNSWQALARKRRGNAAVPELSISQIREQLGLAVDRVMTEGSLYDPELAALALKQAQGDIAEAVFLLRAYRTTLPRFGGSEPVDTAQMVIRRRISATFKDVPGGQILGPTYDYTQRLLDFSLASNGSGSTAGDTTSTATVSGDGPYAKNTHDVPRVTELLNQEGLVEQECPQEGDPDPPDLTRDPLEFPAGRAARLQNLARGDEGFLLALAYSSQRGYAHTHPFAAEIRYGRIAVEFIPPELGFPIHIGEIEVTECQMVNQFAGSASEPPKFTRGYGMTFGHCERKSMAMALVDRSLRAEELGEPQESPAQMPEFVLSHSDSVEASGFVQHLKLPHYVDFQSELELVRRMRAAFGAGNGDTPE
jgi:alpha-D-ribose 1-methylphosphonate 5-triphosphate synthase subunit PhnI